MFTEAPTLKDMKPIKARDEEVDLTTNLGKAISITANTPTDQQASSYLHFIVLPWYRLDSIVKYVIA